MEGELSQYAKMMVGELSDGKCWKGNCLGMLI